MKRCAWRYRGRRLSGRCIWAQGCPDRWPGHSRVIRAVKSARASEADLDPASIVALVQTDGGPSRLIDTAIRYWSAYRMGSTRGLKTSNPWSPKRTRRGSDARVCSLSERRSKTAAQRDAERRDRSAAANPRRRCGGCGRGLRAGVDRRRICLAHATVKRRCLVTTNIADFALISTQWRARGASHAGLVYIANGVFPQNRSISSVPLSDALSESSGRRGDRRGPEMLRRAELAQWHTRARDGCLGTHPRPGIPASRWQAGRIQPRRRRRSHARRRAGCAQRFRRDDDAQLLRPGSEVAGCRSLHSPGRG